MRRQLKRDLLNVHIMRAHFIAGELTPTGSVRGMIKTQLHGVLHHIAEVDSEVTTRASGAARPRRVKTGTKSQCVTWFSVEVIFSGVPTPFSEKNRFKALPKPFTS